MIEKLRFEDGLWVDEEDAAYDSKQSYLLEGVLGFCSCGDRRGILKYVRDMLLRIEQQDWKSLTELPYIFFVQWANDKDFADHGTSIIGSWLTPRGEELLRDVEACLEEDE